MSQKKRLVLLLGLNPSMIVGLVVVGLAAHSLGVLAAGGDYIAYAAAIGLGIMAVSVRDRAGGRSRATTYAALVNASALAVVTVVVIVEAVRRLSGGTPTVDGLPELIVRAVSTVVMVGGALILGATPAARTCICARCCWTLWTHTALELVDD